MATGTRSHAYPSHTIEDSIALVKEIYSKYGPSVYVTREQIADLLNIAEGTVQTKVSSSVQYGLLEMKAKEGYKPSGLFVRIHKPLDESEKTDALIETMRSPKLYFDLIKEFEGQIVPYTTGLAIVLFRKHHIAENASSRAAAVFIENAKFIGALGPDNTLYRGLRAFESTTDTVAENEELHINHQISNTTSERLHSQKPRNFTQNFNSNQEIVEVGETSYPVRFKSGKKARIIVPDDLAVEDYDRIIEWASFMKGSF